MFDDDDKFFSWFEKAFKTFFAVWVVFAVFSAVAITSVIGVAVYLALKNFG